MKPEDEPSQKPAAGKPVGKFERQVTRQPPGAAKPAEVVRFEPRPRANAEAARPPAAPAKPAPPPALPQKPDTERTPLAPPGKRIRLIQGAGKVRYFALPRPRPPAAAEPPPAAAAKQTLPAAPAAKPAAPAAPAPKPVSPPAGTVKRLKLTDRDRQLMGLLATTRYLSLEQLQRVISPGRNLIDLHKRTLALGGEGKYGVERPYLRRLSYRNYLGEPETAWMLTPLGYNVAETVLATPPRRPTAETGANFIEHGLFANELYVQLLEAPLRQALAAARLRAEHEHRPSRSFTRQKAEIYARAAHPGLRWHSHDEVRLPWREYAQGKHHARVIIPDATLEIPGAVMGVDPRFGEATRFAGRRIFLEAETGSQTMVPEGDTKPGATVNKLDRYTTYVTAYAEGAVDGDRASWYTRAHPDNFEPTVLFLVRNAGREAAVNRAIAEWQRETPGNQDRIQARALTVEKAAAWFLSMLGATWAVAAPPATATGTRPEPQHKAPRVINSAEYNVLSGYAKSSHALHQRHRADVRSRGEAPPEYPEETEAMNALLAKLFR